MSEVQPVSGADPQPIVDAAGNKTPHGSPTASMDTKVGSLEELKKVAPEVYNAMMKGMADNIISEMRHRQARLKKIMRENTSRDKGG